MRATAAAAATKTRTLTENVIYFFPDHRGAHKCPSPPSFLSSPSSYQEPSFFLPFPPPRFRNLIVSHIVRSGAGTGKRISIRHRLNSKRLRFVGRGHLLVGGGSVLESTEIVLFEELFDRFFYSIKFSRQSRRLSKRFPLLNYINNTRISRGLR